MINCGPCQKALPYNSKIKEYFVEKDDVDFFVFYPMDLKEKLQKYATKKNIDYPIIYNSFTQE